MEHQGLRTGHLIALGGALVTLSSLWRPWYAVDLSGTFRDELSSKVSAQAPAGLGQLAQRLISALPSRIEASGWRELAGADVVLCIGALAVVALVLGAAGALGSAVRVDRLAAGRIIAALGLVGVAVVSWHIFSKPGGGAGSELVKLASGIWIALAGCLLTTIGGLTAAAPPRPLPYSPEPPASFEGLAPAPEPGEPALSIGPPAR
jgi:hypothetical protein